MDVLLATFNGERFLEEQLESLDRQEDVCVRVWVNDDGSTDETLRILHQWQEKGLIMRISTTNKIGSTRAFLGLLSEHADSEFIAFCDQDDIWESKKLTTQMSNLEREIPMCVTSQRLYIDAVGKIIGESKKLRNSPSFENAMIENIAPGNTILINSLAINLINRYHNPPVKHYDSWIYLVLAFFGKVVYIEKPLLKYRIHEGNHVGIRKYDLRGFLDSAKNFTNQAKYLSKIIKMDVGQDTKPVLADFISICAKKSKVQKAFLIMKLKIQRQRRIDQMGMKAILLVLILTSKV